MQPVTVYVDRKTTSKDALQDHPVNCGCIRRAKYHPKRCIQDHPVMQPVIVYVDQKTTSKDALRDHPVNCGCLR